MEAPTTNHDGEMDRLAEDARALVDATMNIAGDELAEAHRRLAAALDDWQAIYDRVRDQAAKGAAVAERSVRERPYQAIAIAAGAGAILGFLAASLCSRNGD